MTGTVLALAALFLACLLQAHLVGYRRGKSEGAGWERLRCCQLMLAFAKKRDLILELTPLREQIVSGIQANSGRRHFEI